MDVWIYITKPTFKALKCKRVKFHCVLKEKYN